MSLNDRSGPPRARAGTPELLLRAALFMVIVIAAVIAVIRADAWWTSLLAAGGVAVGACGVAMVAFALLSDEDDAEPETGPSRTGSVLLASVAVVLLVLALVVPEHEAKESTAGTAATAGAAEETVRQFLLLAIVEDDAFPACQYLTTAQQATLVRQAGATSCRLALTGTSPSLDGVQDEADVDRLKIRATVVGDRATAVVAGRGQPPMTFTLTRATPAEAEGFEAPSTPWRIASGAEALVA